MFRLVMYYMNKLHLGSLCNSPPVDPYRRSNRG